MITEQPTTHFLSAPRFAIGRFWRRNRYGGEVGPDVNQAEAVRDALARENALHQQLQSATKENSALQAEANHRISNNFQMVVSFLMMQSRRASPECGPQLAAAAHRVMAAEKIHRRLQSIGATEIVAFKAYLEKFCIDFSGIADTGENCGRDILVTCDDVALPKTIAVPLGFIVNELLTNAVKYGNGRVWVTLESRPGAKGALTVANDGPALPADFVPAASKGLGMNIVQSFIRQIGAEFQFGRGPENRGAQFTVLFPDCRPVQDRQHEIRA